MAILAVCALAFSLCAPVEAKTAKAATMRLEKTQGTVTLRSGAGKTLTQSDGMKLYSGNSLADAAKSYAWVSLDSSKAVKLGASSSVTVKQSGKKLELNLTSGKLFFDVKTPLASDESLSIRTSTTVTGIRGTCGVVEVTKDSKTGEDCTRVTIFEGSVVVTTAEPAAGTTNTLTVSAGKWMQITSDNGRVVNGTIDDTSDLGFAMVDIAADPALLARINAATALGEKIKTTAAKQLAIDEGDEQKAIDALPANKIVVTDPVFSEPVYVGGGGGGGGSYVPPVTSKTLTMANFANSTDTIGTHIIQDALNNYSMVYLDLTGTSDVSLNIDYTYTQDLSGLTIPDGKTLYLQNGNAKVEAGNGIIINGSLKVDSTATLLNSGTIVNNSSNSFHNYGSFTNNGTFTNGANGLIENTNTFANNGTITNNGTFTNSGTFTNVSGTEINGYRYGTLTNNGTFTNSNTLENYTTASNGWSGEISNNGTISNTSLGSIDVAPPETSGGDLNIEGSGTLKSDGISGLKVKNGEGSYNFFDEIGYGTNDTAYGYLNQTVGNEVTVSAVTDIASTINGLTAANNTIKLRSNGEVTIDINTAVTLATGKTLTIIGNENRTFAFSNFSGNSFTVSPGATLTLTTVNIVDNGSGTTDSTLYNSGTIQVTAGSIKNTLGLAYTGTTNAVANFNSTSVISKKYINNTVVTGEKNGVQTL